MSGPSRFGRVVFLLPSADAGGITQFYRLFGEALRRLGRDVEYLAWFDEDLSWSPKAYRELPSKHFQDVSIRGRSKGDRTVRRLLTGFDWIDGDTLITHRTPWVPLLIWKLRDSGKKISYLEVIHGENEAWQSHAAEIGSKVDALWAVNPTIGGQITNLVRNCLDLHAGVEPPVFGSFRSSCSKILRLSWVGRIAWQEKGCETLLEALRILDRSGIPFHCDVVGDGPDRGRLEVALGSLDSPKSEVRCHGTLPNHQVLKIFDSVDVLLHTAPSEAGPLVLLEAASRGVVPLSTPVGLARDRFAPKWPALVHPSEELPNGLLKLASEPQAIEPLRSAIRKFAAENFTLEKQGEKLQEFLLELIPHSTQSFPRPRQGLEWLLPNAIVRWKRSLHAR